MSILSLQTISINALPNLVATFKKSAKLCNKSKSIPYSSFWKISLLHIFDFRMNDKPSDWYQKYHQMKRHFLKDYIYSSISLFSLNILYFQVQITKLFYFNLYHSLLSKISIHLVASVKNVMFNNSLNI